MPVIGVVDPKWEAWSMDNVGQFPRWYEKDELLEYAVDAPPGWSDWTYEVINACLAEQQERDYISTSMLVDGCYRSKVIERRAEYVAELEDMWAPFLGTLVHRTLENSVRPGGVAEARFWTTFDVPKVGKVEVSCSPDAVFSGTPKGSLVDYKKTEQAPPYGNPWGNHTQQVNLNRFIVNNAVRWETQDGSDLPWNPRTLAIGSLYIVYMTPKGPKLMECLKAQPWKFKNGNEGTKKLPYVWSDRGVLDFLEPRLYNMLRALDAYPEWPAGLEDEPGWAGPAGWDCPGYPLCKLPRCLAKRYSNGYLVWDKDGGDR